MAALTIGTRNDSASAEPLSPTDKDKLLSDAYIEPTALKAAHFDLARQFVASELAGGRMIIESIELEHVGPFRIRRPSVPCVQASTCWRLRTKPGKAPLCEPLPARSSINTHAKTMKFGRFNQGRERTRAADHGGVRAWRKSVSS